MSKILITGATGQLGAAVIENLLERTDASHIRVLVRDAEKASSLKDKGVEIAIGDYDDYKALLAALKDIDKLYLVSGNDITNRASQHENVINAAKEAGVKQIVYTSFQRKKNVGPTAIPLIANSHIRTEELLKASGLTYTILQHGLYADIIPVFVGKQVLENKSIYLPGGNGSVSFALRTDFAEAGSTVLLEETNKFDNKEIELTGSEILSWQEIADLISEISGETIVYTSPSVEEFESVLKNAGVPSEYIGIFTTFNQAISAGEFDEVSSELENLLGRKPVSTKAYLQSVYGE